MFSKFSLIALLVFALAVLSPASATVINTYSSYTAWAAETVPGFTTIPFTAAFYGASLSLSGATFTTGNSEELDAMNTTASYWNYGLPYMLSVVAPSNLAPLINVALPSNITSIGLNLTTVSPYDDPLTVTVNGVSYSITSTSPTGGLAFFGATFDAPITSFQIQSTAGDYLLTNNFSFGTQNDTSGSGGGDPSPTPEATSLLMIGSGLVGMRIMGKMHLFGA